MSPLRHIPGNGNPLLKFLGNAFTGERILQRPTQRAFRNSRKASCLQNKSPAYIPKSEGSVLVIGKIALMMLIASGMRF